MPKRLLVIDGADKGQSFLLPEAGTVRIGNSRKHTDICLHDLFVARVHCQIGVEGTRVTVSDQVTPNGILVNGAKVTQRELLLGDVVRVGNSYLRLEESAAAAAEADGTSETNETVADGPKKLPQLPPERLGELTGHTLGHFKVGVVLANGHCGTVFRARDLKTDEAVALKVLSPAFPADAEEMQRFVRVMKPLLAVHHPNLVAPRGAGKAGPYVWVAGELIDGESLAQVIPRLRTARKIEWRPALRVARHAARALDCLRQHHLVHANITPANILLAGEDGPARLADLGLWDALAGSALQRQVLDRKLHAELPYLSPEHINPDVPVDDLSDQYSLGTVVYGLLTGRPPFEGETPEETMARIYDALPVKPKEYQRSIPDGLQAAVLRMLAKYPEDRYPAPGPLLADLDALTAEYGEED
jgi:serine/threonine protein kinase